MQFTTKLVAAGTIQVTSEDPEVIEQLTSNPDARLIDGAGAAKRFELPKNVFDVHFPVS